MSSRRVMPAVLIVQLFVRLGIVIPVAAGMDGATASLNEAKPVGPTKKPLPKALVGTSWSAASLFGPSLDLAAPSPSVMLLWKFTNTKFVPSLQSVNKNYIYQHVVENCSDHRGHAEKEVSARHPCIMRKLCAAQPVETATRSRSA
ncbi:MAG: hypothetical protein ACKVP3_27580 [Hyphomicrobiaceae bacterium]